MHLSRESINEFLSFEVGHLLVKERPDDRYIISYPRSGNTWMRTMLAYMFEPQFASNPDLRNALFPGVSIRKAPKINKLESPRFLKSHSWYQRGIPKALYLVRDGRDVLISLYHYRITRRGIVNVPFPLFFNNYCLGKYGHLWHENVESWFTKGKEAMGDKMMVVRFEDLKVNTETIMEQIIQFLEINISLTSIRGAIEASQPEQMRKVEKERLGELSDPNQSFYRGGKTGGWKEYFLPEIEERFFELSSNAMQLAGYVHD